MVLTLLRIKRRERIDWGREGTDASSAAGELCVEVSGSSRIACSSRA